MINLLDSNAAYVYGFKDIKNGKFNIGLKTPGGSDKSTYVSSIESPEFWERYSLGLMERSILFVGDLDTAKTLEWFGLDYGTKTQKDKFYNFKNNAHCVDESLLTKDMKQVVIDFIEGVGKGIEYGNENASDAEANKNIVINISDKMETTIPTYVPIYEADKYLRYQVREELVNHNTVSRIRARLLENPVLARETFKPIAVVVMANGNKMVVNGNTRLAAATKTQGWNDVPVVFINESEFGSTDKIRNKNYRAFGLYMNKEEFEIRVTNSKEDLKRNIENFILDEKLDLSKSHHIDRARSLIYDNFGYLCGSKQQLNGVLASILSDFEKNQASLQYQQNLITYSESHFKHYGWKKYESNDIAYISATVSETAYAKPLAYICRRMKNTKMPKGAIILHYTTKQDIASEAKAGWIGDLIDTINFMELDIIVDVLPAFAEYAKLDV